MRRYNLTSQMYDDRYRQEQEAKYRAALEGLNLQRDSWVLDVGCGSGLFFSHIMGAVQGVVGVDVSRKLLLQAHQRAKPCGNVSVVLADADHLPFKEDVFDFVFAFTVLQNMPKPVETLKQLRAVAAGDARFVVTGLKAALSLEVFGELLETAGLTAVSLRSDDTLRCNVVQCIQRSV
jgi:demethylmenaquinone methyltransferase/2-methoxy-6-polyprenyl-1,4-benzoquinol methylase